MAFLQNSEEIKRINKESINYSIGLNEFSDMSHEEFIGDYTNNFPIEIEDGIYISKRENKEGDDDFAYSEFLFKISIQLGSCFYQSNFCFLKQM